jgi:hypothetical protein
MLPTLDLSLESSGGSGTCPGYVAQAHFLTQQKSGKNKIRTSSQWRWPEALATGGMKEIEFYFYYNG